VQLGLPFLRRFAVRPQGPVLLQKAGRVFNIHLVPMRAARRYILRVRPDGALRVTIPRGGSRAEALRFAERHLGWAMLERARLLATPRVPSVWTAGTVILLNGEPTTIVRERGTVGSVARAGPVAANISQDQEDLRPALERAMRDVARRELPQQLQALAKIQGLEVTGISIRNQLSRWGSCSRHGRIALNFRLIQMPPAVREYILLHELMHLRQANHSRRFWSLVESVCPHFRESERWLKTTGRTLF
jgi:predicted metal-dependent hydrolase